MKGSEIEYEDFIRMLYAVKPPERQYARWVMTQKDWDDLVSRHPVESHGPKALFGKPVHLDETAEGITFEPGPPPLPGVLLIDGDIIEYQHSYRPQGPAVGFASTERRWSAQARSSSMRVAPELEAGP